ncbi:hypothetical protein IC582_022467 [Cucumis melo]
MENFCCQMWEQDRLERSEYGGGRMVLRFVLQVAEGLAVLE